MGIAQFSGLASGIDSGALIDAIIEARSTRNIIRQNEIDHLESENDSLEELNTRVLNLEELIDKFRTTNGGGVNKKATSSDPSKVTASASADALNSSFTVTTTSVADVGVLSFNNSFTGLDDLVADTGNGSTTGSVTIKVGDAAGSNDVDITVAVTQDSTTVQQFIDAFNNDSNSTGRAVASAVNIGTTASPDYRIMITTTEQGTDKGNITLDSSTGTQTELVTNGQTTDQATNAVFTLSGITGSITRETNVISDVLNGITLNLEDTGASTITVGNDGERTSDDIAEIVDVFNDIISFINENNQVTRVENEDNATNVFGSLAKTRIDDDFISAIRSDLSAASASTGVQAQSMADLHVLTNRDGSLSFDADKFAEVVAQDADGVTAVLRDFADRAAGVGNTIHQFTRLEGFIDTAQSTNSDEIENLNEAIAALDRSNEQLRERLTLQFARLEQRIGDLQSQQSALSGILAGLG